jgi:glucokinase
MTKEKMEELSLKGIPSKLFEVAEKEGKVSARTAFDAMRLGDDYAKKIVDDYIFYLAEGVTNMINIFQPDILTIGGGVCNEKDYLMVPLLRHVEREQYTRDNKNKTKVMIAALKNDAGIIGAAGLEA